MKRAIKNKQKVVIAYQLGTETAVEKRLIESGAIKRNTDDSYELFSQEAVNGKGEIAQRLDYFKIDEKQGNFYPYPIRREYFESTHRHISGNKYIQVPQPLQIWEYGDEISEELQFLLDSGNLIIDENNPERYYNAFLWGAELSAPSDAVIVFYNVTRGIKDKIEFVDFNFVARKEFNNNYSCL